MTIGPLAPQSEGAACFVQKVAMGVCVFFKKREEMLPKLLFFIVFLGKIRKKAIFA